MANAVKHKKLKNEKESKELEKYYDITNHFYDNNLMFIHCLINNVLEGINKPTNAVILNIELEEFVITELVTEEKEKLTDLDLVKLELANKLIEQLKANNSLFHYKKPKERIQYEENYYLNRLCLEPDINEEPKGYSNLIDLLEDITDSSREFIIKCLIEELDEIEEVFVND